MISFLEFYRILESIDPYSSDAYLKVVQSKYGWIDPRHGFYPSSAYSHFEVLKSVPKYSDLVEKFEQAEETLRNAEDDWRDKPGEHPEWHNFGDELENEKEILRTEIYLNVYSDGWVRIAIEGKTVHAEGTSAALTKLNGDIEDLANAINGQVQKRARDQDLIAYKKDIDAHYASKNGTTNPPKIVNPQEFYNKIIYDGKTDLPIYVIGAGSSPGTTKILYPDGQIKDVGQGATSSGYVTDYFKPLSSNVNLTYKFRQNQLEQLKQLVLTKYKKQPILT